jgi:hypothetical protein
VYIERRNILSELLKIANSIKPWETFEEMTPERVTRYIISLTD